MEQLEYTAVSEVSGGGAALFYGGLALSAATGMVLSAGKVKDKDMGIPIMVGLGFGTTFSLLSGPVGLSAALMSGALNVVAAAAGYEFMQQPAVRAVYE